MNIDEKKAKKIKCGYYAVLILLLTDIYYHVKDLKTALNDIDNRLIRVETELDYYEEQFPLLEERINDITNTEDIMSDVEMTSEENDKVLRYSNE